MATPESTPEPDPIPTPQPVQWETLEQLASRLNVEGRTIFRAIAKGQLPAPSKIGRRYLFDPLEVDEYIRNGRNTYFADTPSREDAA